MLLWNKIHLTRCSSWKLPLLSLRTTWNLSWSKLRVTVSLVLASSVRILPCTLHTYVSHKALMGPILSDTISQNSTECLLVMFHTGLLHVQKLTNIYIHIYECKKSFLKKHPETQQEIWISFPVFCTLKSRAKAGKERTVDLLAQMYTRAVGLVQLGDNVLCRSLAPKHCVISM